VCATHTAHVTHHNDVRQPLWRRRRPARARSLHAARAVARWPRAPAAYHDVRNGSHYIVHTHLNYLLTCSTQIFACCVQARLQLQHQPRHTPQTRNTLTCRSRLTAASRCTIVCDTDIPPCHTYTPARQPTSAAVRSAAPARASAASHSARSRTSSARAPDNSSLTRTLGHVTPHAHRHRHSPLAARVSACAIRAAALPSKRVTRSSATACARASCALASLSACSTRSSASRAACSTSDNACRRLSAAASCGRPDACQ
jgi:hypothetical protein